MALAAIAEVESKADSTKASCRLGGSRRQFPCLHAAHVAVRCPITSLHPVSSGRDYAIAFSNAKLGASYTTMALFSDGSGLRPLVSRARGFVPLHHAMIGVIERARALMRRSNHVAVHFLREFQPDPSRGTCLARHMVEKYRSTSAEIGEPGTR